MSKQERTDMTSTTEVNMSQRGLRPTPAHVDGVFLGDRDTAPRRATTARGVRLTRRGRVVVFVVSMLALVGIILVSDLMSASAGDGAPQVATTRIVVQPGESLWQIAREVAPNADPRGVVTAIRETNHLGTVPVVPGQVLVIPAFAGA